MGNRLRFSGMEEFRAALRKLPVALSREGGDIVVARATEAGDEIRDAYERHRDSGNLASHVKVDVQQRPTGASAVVKSTAKHARIFESGTQVRKNAKGQNRGAMPPGNIFIPVVVRKRKEMTEDLTGLLEQSGIEVHGG